MGRGNFQPKQHTVLCSEHFRPECFSAFGNRKNLTHNAVPTEFAFQHPAPVSRPEPGEVTCAGRVGSQVKAISFRLGLGVTPGGAQIDS